VGEEAVKRAKNLGVQGPAAFYVGWVARVSKARKNILEALKRVHSETALGGSFVEVDIAGVAVHCR